MTELAQKLDVLEGEITLMKGELWQTLIDVRAFLENVELPAVAFIPEEPEEKPPEPRPFQEEARHEPESVPEEAGEPEPVCEDEVPPPVEDMSMDELPTFEEDDEPWSQDLDEEEDEHADDDIEEEQSEPDNKEASQMSDREEAVQVTSQVNMMANLIRWVSVAKRDIGIEQLPVFLDTYAIAGTMLPQLKDVLLGLAGTIEAAPQDSDVADTWSRLILELHGILTGGGTPTMLENSILAGYNGGIPADAAPQAVEPKPEPVRLKLVLPMGSGQEQEFSVTLNPAAGV